MSVKKSTTFSTPEHVDGSKEEHFFSEDSESTQGSDLDHELNIKVLLPNQSMQTLSVLASTPWGDLRTKLCSQFKFSPSTHVVDFTSISSSQKKRNASCPVGKMGIEMVIVKEKDVKVSVKSKSSTHIPAIASSENTVRLIVHMSRFRQSVLRVHPDVPLAMIFNSICEKLKFNDDMKKRLELRHPTQDDVILDLYQSLNHFNLREVYLAEKPDESGKVLRTKTAPPPPSRTKRKAPLPPQSKTDSKDDDSLKENRPQEQTEKKSRGSKRRAAPQPPQQLSSTLESEVPEQEDSSDFSHQDMEYQNEDIPPQNLSSDKTIPCRPPRTQKSKNSVTGDVTVIPDERVSVHIIDEAVVDDAMSERSHSDHDDVVEKSDVLDDKLSDVIDDPAIKDNDYSEKSSRSSSPHVVDEVKADVMAKEEDCTTSIDDVLQHFDDVIDVADDTSSTNATSHLSADDVPSIGASSYGDIIVYDVSEEGGIFEGNHVQVNSPISEDAIPAFEDSPLREDAPSDVQIDPYDLPPPPPAFLDAAKSHQVISVETLRSPECQDEQETSSPPTTENYFPPPCANLNEMEGSVTPQPEENLPNPSLTSEEETRSQEEEKLSPIPHIIETPTEPPSVKAKPASEMSESEKTALEIEKLHLQIKKMKNRSSLKQERGTNSWHSGTKCFTFIPHRKNEATHDDYTVAPVGGIELSNNGEIKTLHHHEDGGNKPNESYEVHRHQSALPSYYKKFLGMNFSSNAK